MRFREFYEGLEDVPSAAPEENKKDTDMKDVVLPDEPMPPGPEDKKQQVKKTEVKPEEEAPEEEPKTLASIFDENKSKVKAYVMKKQYDAKPAEGGERLPKFGIISNASNVITTAKEGDFILRDHDNLKKEWAISGKEYASHFEPIFSNQKPDAEGNIKVRSSNSLDGFLYAGDDVELNSGKTLSKGVYLLKQNNKSPFTLDKMKFEKDYEVQ